jgi:hypothetical protein
MFIPLAPDYRTDILEGKGIRARDKGTGGAMARADGVVA